MQNSTWQWWHLLLFSLLCAGIAVYLYFDLTELERTGGTKSMNAILVALYDLGGKWAVVGFFVVAALGSLGLMVRMLLRGGRAPDA